MGIDEVITAVRSPWQNAYAERLIGSIRRECLDHVIIGNARGLRRVLHAYVAYLLELPNAPLAQQRCADLATCRVTGRWRHRRDSTSRWPAPSVRTPRRVRRTALESNRDVSADRERRDAPRRLRAVELCLFSSVGRYERTRGAASGFATLSGHVETLRAGQMNFSRGTGLTGRRPLRAPSDRT